MVVTEGSDIPVGQWANCSYFCQAVWRELLQNELESSSNLVDMFLTVIKTCAGALMTSQINGQRSEKKLFLIITWLSVCVDIFIEPQDMYRSRRLRFPIPCMGCFLVVIVIFLNF